MDNDQTKTQADSKFVWILFHVLPIAVLAIVWLIISYNNTANLPNVATTISFSIAILFASLLGFWLGLGHGWPRFLLVPMLTPSLGVVVGYDKGEQLEFQIFFSVIVAIVATTSVILRFTKGSLRYFKSQTPEQDALQFGIRQLFIWTTIVAVIVGLGPRLYGWINITNSPRTHTMLIVVGIASCISIGTIANIWVFLGARLTIVKSFVLLTAIAGVALAAWKLVPGNNEFFLAMTISSMILVGLAFFGLRMTGLRFGKRQLLQQ